MPHGVRQKMGHAVSEAQFGRTVEYATQMKGSLREVTEVVTHFDGDTYRLMYTVKLHGRVYVLDVFQKKSKHGIATPRSDLARVELRLKAAKAHFETTR